MICDECGSREAKINMTVVSGRESRVRHLCPECAEKLRSKMNQGTLEQFLASLMGAMRSTVDDENLPEELREALRTAREEDSQPRREKPDDGQTCPVCGTALGKIRESRRVGCTSCYAAFGAKIYEEGERPAHVGRQPLNRRGTPNWTQIEQLRRQMAEAVIAEDYERAAKLRDQIHALAAGDGEA